MSEQIWRSFTDDPERLTDFVEYTARTTGFRAELVEKDYHCSVVLHALANAGLDNLVFKGGTCLSKAFGSFYRMSEDLDFVIPVATGCRRVERRRLIAPVKEACAQLPTRCPGLEIARELRGANESTQYLGTLAYSSRISNRQETIKLEFGLREPLLLPSERRDLATLLTNNITGETAVPKFPAQVMSLSEVLAEKTRAALSRREPAIRDFFDLDFAVRELGLQLSDELFHDLVAAKLSVPGNNPVDMSPSRHEQLARQVDRQLKPVLRRQDFEQFELDRIFAALSRIAEALEDRR